MRPAYPQEHAHSHSLISVYVFRLRKFVDDADSHYIYTLMRNGDSLAHHENMPI